MTSFTIGQLTIKSKTWSRDSYGLYDYETSSLNIQNFTATGPCDLMRVDNEINLVSPLLGIATEKIETLGDAKETVLPLVSVFDSPGNINMKEMLRLLEGIKIVSNTKERGGPDDFWSIVERGENADGYMLKAGDVIKLGRVVFKINQIKVVQSHETAAHHPQKAIMNTIKEHMQKDEQNKEPPKELVERKSSCSASTCKICLSEKEETDDPLISPCHCTGSVKYVHLQCMQNWVKSKLNMQQNKNIVTIYWKNLYCELCKQKLPIHVVHNGDELSLIPIGNKITGSHVIMESFSKEKDSTGIHLIDLSSNQNFKMGRGHDCDLKIHDISVSRVHALLVVSKGKLYLKDNLSKFGTLVLHKGPIIISEDISISPWIQCGRTIFKFTLKRSWFSLIPCVGTLFGYNSKVAKTERLLDEGNTHEDPVPGPNNDGEESKKDHTEEI